MLHLTTDLDTTAVQNDAHPRLQVYIQSPSMRPMRRFRAVALPLAFAQEQVAAADGELLRQISNRDELTLAVHAAFVAGLKQVRTL